MLNEFSEQISWFVLSIETIVMLVGGKGSEMHIRRQEITQNITYVFVKLWFAKKLKILPKRMRTTGLEV